MSLVGFAAKLLDLELRELVVGQVRGLYHGPGGGSGDG
jgi:hypothetical protein